MSTKTGRIAELRAVAKDLVGGERGILAADESIGTMNVRLEGVEAAPTEENRRAYRELLVTTPDLAAGTSGVILCDETFRQRVADGRTFPEALAALGVHPGIKVDTGVRPLAGAPGESITEGLDGLGPRLADYARLGARFAKWRAVITIGDSTPSSWALQTNAHSLARYARECQEAAIVPIVEPEVLMDGDHSQQVCSAVTSAALLLVFRALADAEVDLQSMVLKPNMVVPAVDSWEVCSPEEVAELTVRTLRPVVPSALAGIAFLSGGQPSAAATANLAAMRRLDTPWPVTFSFGRALVSPALQVWRGDPSRVVLGQAALSEQVRANTTALQCRPPKLHIA